MPEIPEGFAPLTLRPAGFTELVGPVYGRQQEGRFVLGLRIEPRHCNAAGLCHGGMLTALADMLLVIGSERQADPGSFLGSSAHSVQRETLGGT